LLKWQDKNVKLDEEKTNEFDGENGEEKKDQEKIPEEILRQTVNVSCFIVEQVFLSKSKLVFLFLIVTCQASHM